MPRNSEEERSKEVMKSYKRLLGFVTIIRALEGCIESPLQLLYKTSLMFNGIIEFKFTSASFAIKDLHGNNIPVPFFINFLISSVTLLKSVYSLNVPFFKTQSTSKYFKKLAWLDFVGFLVTSTLFKLGSLILLLGYLNLYTILPIIAIIFFGYAANSKTVRDHQNIPNLLLVFMNLSVPICFTTKCTEDISKVQAKNLKYQTWISSAIYGFSLMILGFLVYYAKLNMNSELPITFQMFRVLISSTFLLGVLATLFSIQMNILNNLPLWKKTLLAMIKLIRIIALIGIVTASLNMVIFMPKEENEASFMIWNKDFEHPKTFTGQVIVPPEEEKMKMTLQSVKILRAEEIQRKGRDFIGSKHKAIIILDNEKAKPSSPFQYNYYDIPTILLRDTEAYTLLTEGHNDDYPIEIASEYTQWKINIYQQIKPGDILMTFEVEDALYTGINEAWKMTIKDNNQPKNCTEVINKFGDDQKIILASYDLDECKSFLRSYTLKDLQLTKSLKLEFKPEENVVRILHRFKVFVCNEYWWKDPGSVDKWSVEIPSLCKTNPIKNFKKGEWTYFDSHSTLGDCYDYTITEFDWPNSLFLNFRSDGTDDMAICEVYVDTISSFSKARYIGEKTGEDSWTKEEYGKNSEYIGWGPLKLVKEEKNQIKLKSVKLEFCLSDCDIVFAEYVATDISDDYYSMKDGFELTLKRKD